MSGKIFKFSNTLYIFDKGKNAICIKSYKKLFFSLKKTPLLLALTS